MSHSTPTHLTSHELSALAYIVSARHVAEMSDEFWEALASLRKRGLVAFRCGHWIAMTGPILQLSQSSATEMAQEANA